MGYALDTIDGRKANVFVVAKHISEGFKRRFDTATGATIRLVKEDCPHHFRIIRSFVLNACGSLHDCLQIGWPLQSHER
eukprot:260856-Pyramimonas_sp.AAC.1